MKKIKVFYHGERLKDIYPYSTKWQVFKFKVRKLFTQLVFLGVMAGIVFSSFKLGQNVFPNIVYANREVPSQIESPTPVMERIAKCESGGTHYRNGQVIYNANSNKTVDIGIYQINSIWNKKATELGYDLTKEKDNIAFAMWLYKNQGTGAWSASAKCWNK